MGSYREIPRAELVRAPRRYVAATATLEPRVDVARLLRETAPLMQLRGPGTAAVRTAARRLVVALDLLQQQSRRNEAEVLRCERARREDVR